MTAAQHCIISPCGTHLKIIVRNTISVTVCLDCSDDFLVIFEVEVELNISMGYAIVPFFAYDVIVLTDVVTQASLLRLQNAMKEIISCMVHIFLATNEVLLEQCLLLLVTEIHVSW